MNTNTTAISHLFLTAQIPDPFLMSIVCFPPANSSVYVNTIDLMLLMCFIPQIVLLSLSLSLSRLFASFFYPSSALCLHLYYCQNIFFFLCSSSQFSSRITLLCDQKGWKGRNEKKKKTNTIFVDFHMKFDILNRINRLNIKFRIYGKSELLLLLDDDVGVHLIKIGEKKSATINDIKSHNIGVTDALMNGKF